MTDYRAVISNCLMIGENFTLVGDQRIRNLINVSIKQFSIGLIEHADIIDKGFGAFKDHSFHTTDLIVRNILETQFDEIDTIANEIAELLSFATSSPVAKFGYDFGQKGLRTGVMGQIEYFCPTIDTIRGDFIRTFLEQTWPKYHALRDRWKINLAFSYYVLSQQSGQPMELLLAVSFVLLENLKHHFALNNGYPFIRGFFRQRGAILVRPGIHKTFEELLAEMFQQVGMNPNLTPIIELRNDLIHSGLSSKPHAEQTDIYKACQDIIREYLLRLLSYTGYYHKFSTPNAYSVI